MKKLVISLFVFLSTQLGLNAQTLVLHRADGTTTDVELYLILRLQPMIIDGNRFNNT